MTSNPFGDLAFLRERPIPPQEPVRTLKAGYRQDVLDAADPRGVEPLVDVESRGLAAFSYYAQPRNPPYYEALQGATPRVLLRQGAVERLLTVEARLRPRGLELLLLDGWRSAALQAHMHDVWVPGALRTLRPALGEAEIAAQVSDYWSAPTRDPASPAPHSTGGAIDLTIRWAADHTLLWMGSLFDETSPLAHLDHFEAEDDPAEPVSFSALEARRNRRLLYWLMTEAGFAGNPTEWWHYGYGELMWARLTGQGPAFYGAIEQP